jgi:L-threonylcarbamoyladenylate synthase
VVELCEAWKTAGFNQRQFTGQPCRTGRSSAQFGDSFPVVDGATGGVKIHLKFVMP